MSDQSFDANAADTSSNQSKDSTKQIASDATRKVSALARDTGAGMKQAVVQATSDLGDEVRGMLDKQLTESWKFAGQVASSFKTAADDLDTESPVAAGIVRNLAGKLQTYAEDSQDQTVDDILRSASDFARQQPAVTFGLGALAGFLLFRAITTAASASAREVSSHYD